MRDTSKRKYKKDEEGSPISVLRSIENRGEKIAGLREVERSTRHIVRNREIDLRKKIDQQASNKRETYPRKLVHVHAFLVSVVTL